MNKAIFLLCFFLSLIINLFSQSSKAPIFFGIGADYNFQTEGKAPELRLMLPLSNSFFFTPRFSFFPSMNKINEYYAGADIDYFINTGSVFYPFVFAGVYYDNWINYKDFHNKLANKNNIVPEAGAGMAFDLGCINPYAEFRYDAKWKEGTLDIGLLLHFGSCFGSKSSGVDKCAHF